MRDQSMMNHPPLDPERFDAITSGPEKLWGLPAISKALGVSVDTVRRWARHGRAPIYRPDGERYFALRSELNAWLRGMR
ncbi:helix-turn-helix domain-containing protein [Cereibacter azotoformans]|uniref:Excisionase family DNA binding protein n=2 Tax=Cereibacter azotoformans TaxID=43057 RepID=A0A2T5JLK6_9RHOB|nr:helix-turn-helix domain-containing protein [Cereibacter azotoformans]AXQ94007.1 DNA-binding protein [Cereibacter sphaeroides]PTR07771.1 excisionase family DNA binding protein [Cereibacter azotoformans]UIJ29532.1 helix-turn-helix domain-containing protein [Cereibacter azotoformans]